jgi:hypothetical protein
MAVSGGCRGSIDALSTFANIFTGAVEAFLCISLLSSII